MRSGGSCLSKIEATRARIDIRRITVCKQRWILQPEIDAVVEALTDEIATSDDVRGLPDQLGFVGEDW